MEENKKFEFYDMSHLTEFRKSIQAMGTNVKNGTIGVTIMPNGRYDYDEEDVYKFLNKDCKRKIVIYSRVSTRKQKKDLDNQINMLKQFWEEEEIISTDKYRLVKWKSNEHYCNKHE